MQLGSVPEKESARDSDVRTGISKDVRVTNLLNRSHAAASEMAALF